MSWFTFRHEAMATFFEIAIAAQPEEYARQASAAAFREIDRLERELSRFIESSDVARANRLKRDESLAVGPDAMECLLVAADVALATHGAFDAAYASERAPDVDRAVPPFLLDPDTCTITSRALRLKLDFGAVGKGYALDRAADLLREWKVTAACLVAGGSTVLAMDPPPNLKGWQIGIGDDPAIRSIDLAGAAVSASGTAVKGSHLIDPRTGKAAVRPSRTWALAANAAQSDALSTAFFVFSDPEIAEFCAAHPAIGAAVTGADHQLTAYGTLHGLLGGPRTATDRADRQSC